jgi:DNA mismatch repair protein MutS2
MAERLGLPAAVVADARSRRDEKEAQAEALLKQLEEEQAALAREEARMAEMRAELEAALLRQRAAERDLVARKRTEAETFVRDLRRKGEEAARKAADAIGEAVARVEAARGSPAAAASRAREGALRSIRAAQDEVLRDPELGQGPEEEAVPLAVGMRVRTVTLGITGEVLALHGQEAEVAVAGKRLRVPQAELRPLPVRPAGPGAAPPATVTKKGEVAAEINLLGLTVDEALPRVDKLLDDAALSDRREIRVIHGFGEGRLRKAVAGLLQGHPHVAAWRAGHAGEGGGGVTIVELKE